MFVQGERTKFEKRDSVPDFPYLVRFTSIIRAQSEKLLTLVWVLNSKIGGGRPLPPRSVS